MEVMKGFRNLEEVAKREFRKRLLSIIVFSRNLSFGDSQVTSLAAGILVYAKLRLRKQSRTRRQISIATEVVIRQCLKKYKSF